MKWLLVTTNPVPNYTPGPLDDGGWNIGDIFARIGTEQIIREVDPSAEFDFLNVSSHASITTPRTFDRCVLAGRPMFWRECEKHPLWTHVLNGWAGADRRRIMALGVGACYPLGEDPAHLHRAIEAAAGQCWRVVLRFPCEAPLAVRSVCPATWVLLQREEEPRLKLCNFMVGGAHYPEFDPDEADIGKVMTPTWANLLRQRGFLFVAHNKQERKVATDLGWAPEQIIFAETVEPYLAAYAQASHYVGNRMHGAAILAGRNARAMAIGYDSRLGMVRRSGGAARTPREVNVAELEAFAETPAGVSDATRVRMIAEERERMKQLVEDFAG